MKIKKVKNNKNLILNKDCPYCGTMNIDFDSEMEMYICPDCGAEIPADEIDDIIDCQHLSVDDAAFIWLSSGFDEDQMFGYSEEELKKALKK